MFCLMIVFENLHDKICMASLVCQVIWLIFLYDKMEWIAAELGWMAVSQYWQDVKNLAK